MGERKHWTVGVISDTHGLLRPEALTALRGADLVVHAGDIGDPGILDALRAIAPIVAVRGNVDRQRWAVKLPATGTAVVGQATLYVLHDVTQLDLDPAAAGFDAVVSGHTHHPSIRERGGVLYVNPGSAGPRRFHLPVSLARIEVRGKKLEAHLVPLDV